MAQVLSVPFGSFSDKVPITVFTFDSASCVSESQLHFEISMFDYGNTNQTFLHRSYRISMDGQPPSASSSSSTAAKLAKQPKQPKADNGTAKPGAEGSATKGKSAKDIKKEKRAAAVAARGGGHDPRQDAMEGEMVAPAGGPPGANVSGHPPSKGRPGAGPAPAAGPSNSSGQTGVYAKGSIPQRPPIMANESAAPFVVKQQNLFFSHLPTSVPQPSSQALKTGKLHPLVLRLGVLMSSGTLRGANARTMAMMTAFKEVIRDYESPEQAVLWKDLMGHLSPMIGWLESCRPKGVGGGNAIRWLKGEINKFGEEGSALSELSERDVSGGSGLRTRA